MSRSLKAGTPWKSPRYEIRQKNLLWGCDWTKLKIGHLRWYLLTVIDFFSRYLIAFDIVPTVNASHVKAVYQMGLKAQGIPLDAGDKPELRVDRGSPNTSWVTKEFFEIIGSELSFARVRRPTDNAITEQFYGNDRPHQALMNFTPNYVHRVNNKTALLHDLKIIKRAARERRKSYWLQSENSSHARVQRGYPGMDQIEIVDCRANEKGILEEERAEKLHSHTEGAESPKNDSLNFLILSHL